jgi:hypothetical protein
VKRAAWRARCGGLVAAWLFGAVSTARAGEAPTFADRSDEETPGPDRAFAVLLDPLAAALSVYGGEVDVVLGQVAALAFTGAIARRDDGAAAAALGVGLLVYPWGRALRGLYLEPQVTFARPFADGIAGLDWGADALGIAATAGWQWTWDYGFTLRLGAGAMMRFGGPRDDTAGAVALGLRPVVDGSVGWAF